MRSRILLIWTACAFLLACSTPQFNYKELGNRVRISDVQGSADVTLTTARRPYLKKDRFYSWYDKGRIGNTQGGYSGKLLDGQYTSWYAHTKQLHEQGIYNKGLKDGVWMIWESDGKVKERQQWNNGIKKEPKGKRSFKSRFIKFKGKVVRLFSFKKKDSL